MTTTTPVPEYVTVLANGQWVLKRDTHISRWAEQHGSIVCDPYLFERVLKPLLCVPDVKVVWDIGAFIGDHTRAYLDMGKEVVAFEPNPLAFDCLLENCPEAIVFNAAVSDKHEDVYLDLSPNVGASHLVLDTYKTRATLTAIPDNLKLPVPDYIKIDAEGWEVKVLGGCRKTIEKHKPIVFCEINRGALERNGNTPEEIFMFFDKLGYTTKTFVPHTANPLDPQYDVIFIY